LLSLLLHLLLLSLLSLLLLSLLHGMLRSPLLLLLGILWFLLQVLRFILWIWQLLLRPWPSRLLLLFLGPALLVLRFFKRLAPVRLLTFRFACLAGLSCVNSLLIKDLIDKILLFEEFYPLNFELLRYLPQFGNKHFAQFKNIMHILRMCRK
jgi:hypothetical protein